MSDLPGHSETKPVCLSPSPWAKAVRQAAEHMANGGELRIVIGAGRHCSSPLPVGSGIIVSELGRLEVSAQTVKMLPSIGLKREHRHIRTREATLSEKMDEHPYINRRGDFEEADIFEVAGKFEARLRSVAAGLDMMLLPGA